MNEGLKRQLVLQVCKKYIGTKESPANSNNVIFNTRFYGREVHNGDKPGATYAWCGTSVSEIFIEAGFPLGTIDYRRGFAGCPYAVKHIDKWGFEVSFDQAEAGDVVFFDFDGNGSWDHVGILKDKNQATKALEVYEGNTSYTDSKDPVEIKKANADGGSYLLRPDRKFRDGRVKFIRPKVYLQ